MLPKIRYSLSLALTLVCVVSLIACHKSTWQQLDTKEVLDILPEYAILTSTLSHKDVPDSIRQQAYREFFQRRNLTLADWDSSMAWYAKNRVKLYNDFYRLSIDSLSRIQRRLQAIEDSIEAIAQYRKDRDAGVLDSVDLLSDTLEVYKMGELINKYRLLRPTLPYDSTTRVHLYARVIGLPEIHSDSLSLELRLHLSDTTSQTERILVGRSGEYELSAQVPDGKQAVRVSANLRGVVPKLKHSGSIWVDRLRLIKYSNQSNSSSTRTLMSVPEEEMQVLNSDFLNLSDE